VVIDDVDTWKLVPTTVANADDDVPLLNFFADGVGETVPVILEMLDHVNTSVAAARAVVNDVILLEASANVNAKVLVPPAVLVNVVSVAGEGLEVPEFATPVALVGLKVEGDELLVPARAELPEEVQAKEGIDPTQGSHRRHTDVDGPGPACLVHGTGVLIFNARRIKVQHLHKTIRPRDEVQPLDISVLNNLVRRLHLFHQCPVSGDFIQIKGQWMMGAHYFTTEPSSSSTPPCVRAGSLDADGHHRGPRKVSRGEGIYSPELWTGTEVQLQNEVRSATLGNECLSDSQPDLLSPLHKFSPLCLPFNGGAGGLGHAR